MHSLFLYTTRRYLSAAHTGIYTQCPCQFFILETQEAARTCTLYEAVSGSILSLPTVHKTHEASHQKSCIHTYAENTAVKRSLHNAVNARATYCCSGCEKHHNNVGTCTYTTTSQQPRYFTQDYRMQIHCSTEDEAGEEERDRQRRGAGKRVWRERGEREEARGRSRPGGLPKKTVTTNDVVSRKIIYHIICAEGNYSMTSPTDKK